MAKTLDFNVIVPPTLPLVMRDAERTRIDVVAPTEGLVEELDALAPNMKQALEADQEKSVPAIYGLAARLISCNEQGLSVSAEELRDKYKLNLEALIVFYNTYMDFLNEIASAKN